MEMKKVKDIACGYGFTIFAVNDTKAHLYGTGLNKDGQIGMKHEYKSELLIFINRNKIMIDEEYY